MEHETSAEELFEAEKYQLQAELGAALQIPQETIELQDAERFLKGGRYVHFFTETGFGKAAKDLEQKKNLKREVFATHLASELGIPAVSVLHNYTETTTENGVFLVEKLTLEDGELFPTNELIAGLESDEAEKVARSVAEFYLMSHFKEIPQDTDSSLLVREGNWAWATQSPERLHDEIATRLSNFEHPLTSEALSSVLGHEKYLTVKEELGSLQQLVEYIGQQHHQPDKEYLVHNDGGISNLFFKLESATPVMALDYECAAATAYPLLGLLRDCQQFYWSIRSNPELQQKFIGALLDAPSPVELSLDDRYFLAKSTALLGTAHFAKFHLPKLESKLAEGIEVADAIKSSDQALLTTILNSLPENLASLNQDYVNIRSLDAVTTNPDSPGL